MTGGVDLKVTGTDKVEAVAARIRAVGDKQLRRELSKAISAATKSPIAEARANALAQLPRAGGLAQLVAESKFSTRTRGGGSNPGVRVEVRGLSVSNLRRLDRGEVRHPVFGNREVWVTQQVHAQWFTAPMLAAAPEVRQAIEKALDDIARRIGG